MEPVRIVQGTAVPLDRSDVDTDQIIPAEWLKRVERTGKAARTGDRSAARQAEVAAGWLDSASLPGVDTEAERVR